MGSSVLDGRPTTVSDIHQFPARRIVLRCTRCPHGGEMLVQDVVQALRLARPTPIYRLESRLRCGQCGAPGRVRSVRGERR